MADDPTPFEGHPLGGSGVTKGTLGTVPGDMSNYFGRVEPATDDPAWIQPPDPLADADALKDRASIINREIPNINVQTGWTIGQTRAAIVGLMAGQFDMVAQLIDSIIGDSRIQASLASLNGGLFSRPIRWDIPQAYENDDKAKRCLDAWQEAWPNLGTEAALSDAMQWDAMLGFWTAQLLWDTNDPSMWEPRLSPWHPRFTYYDWSIRRYIAVTMDGPQVILPGNGKWILHAPHGEYRGWLRGAVRGVAPWWLSRNYALRDASRYSEKHGFPVTKAWTPFGADPAAIAAFKATVSRLGQESIAQLPRSADPKIGSYDLEYLEPSDQSWEVFFRLIEQCNAEITLALQGQNLTSEVKEGSLAAARVHGDVRQSILESKARGFQRTIYTQMAMPFAALNFGNAQLAPRPTWDMSADDDRKVQALMLLNFSQSLNYFRVAGQKVTNVVALAKTFGLRVQEDWFEEVAPLQIEVAGEKSASETGSKPAADTEETDKPEEET